MNRSYREPEQRVVRQADGRRERYVDDPALPQKPRRTGLIVVIILVVVGLCLCVSCVGAVGGLELFWAQPYLDGLTATASVPTPTPPATDTPVPTDTPLPTPTPTITATPDPLGHLNADEKSWQQGFEQQSQRWAEGRQKFDSLMANPNPSDGTWKSEIVGELTVWKDLANQARSLPAPGRFQPAQDRYVQAVERYDMAASLAIEGINNQDVVAFDQSKEEIKEGDTRLNEARDLANSLKQP